MRGRTRPQRQNARPANTARRPAEFAGKQVTVMGLGHFGGGASVTQWLAEQGAAVLVTDLQPAEKLSEPLAQLKSLMDKGAVRTKLGEHAVRDFVDCDLVIANPAVPKPWENQFLRAAADAGVPIVTEIQLVVERLNRQRVIGVTGSAGKSTTAAMIHHVLNGAGVGVHFGGNIGGSLLNHLEQIQPDDWIVLELSSAMLHWLGEGRLAQPAAGWSPHVAVLTNIEPNHLDWHGSFEHYRQSKLNIFRHQEAGDHRVAKPGTTHYEHSNCTPNIGTFALRVPGEHNRSNALLAIEAARLTTDIDPLDAATLLVDFSGLPHRLQLVHEHDGMQFYNDSKSTTPQATLLAIRSFTDASKVHLIAGGYDKKIDLSPVAAIARSIAGLYTIGATGESLAKAAGAGRASAQYCRTLDRAVDAALARMKPGDILLLSPGCASWDQFTNYEQRGTHFVELVSTRRQ